MSEKKSILLVSDTKNWGGWKRAQMINEYLNDQYDFVLMDAEEYNNFQRTSTPNKFSIKEIKKYMNNGKLGNDKDFLDVPHFQQWLNNSKIKREFDLIYFLFHTMLLKKSVKRILKTNQKVITMVTVYPVIRPIFINSVTQRKDGMAEQKFLEQANKCSAILVNNRLSLRDLRRFYNGKSFYAPRGVDPDVFYPTSEEFQQKPHSEFTIAFCGKPNPEKGLDSIIKPSCNQAGVKLITNERNFEDALPEHEMRNFYNSADAYIVASTMDGTPNTALEAAACGKPIVTNAIGNMPEFIKQGENGWLVKKLNIDKYVHRLRWMKNNQKKVWKAGQAARKTILKDWTWEKVLNKNEREIFRKVLNGM